MSSVRMGQYTRLVASAYSESSRTLCTTPITSRHASCAAAVRIRMPIAAPGSVAISRANSSEISATRPPLSMSAHVMSRPATMRVPIASK